MTAGCIAGLVLVSAAGCGGAHRVAWHAIGKADLPIVKASLRKIETPRTFRRSGYCPEVSGPESVPLHSATFVCFTRPRSVVLTAADFASLLSGWNASREPGEPSEDCATRFIEHYTSNLRPMSCTTTAEAGRVRWLVVATSVVRKDGPRLTAGNARAYACSLCNANTPHPLFPGGTQIFVLASEVRS